MTCVVQQDSTNFFLTEAETWTSDLTRAAEFDSIRDALAFREHGHIPDTHIIVFREHRIYRIDARSISRPTPVTHTLLSRH